MIIKTIKLSNFRCHKLHRVDFKPDTTLIIGENGCGKTSVLEAIYEALQGKSFRAVDREIIKHGEEFYRLEVEFFDGSLVTVVYDGQAGKKNFQLLDRKFARLPKKYKYPIVLFEPGDLNMVGASPSRKRDYFDGFMSQFSDTYSEALNKYNKALKQRNELLKQEYVTDDMLFSWNVLLARYGVEICNYRKNIVNDINGRIADIYRSIANNDDDVQLNYIGYVGNVDESGYLKLLALDFERDRITGHTNFGVHKDDYCFVFNNTDADGSASRGEVRSIVIALKFIEAEMLYEKLNKKPVVLLDDVFSELDTTRQKCLMKNFKEHQVIITSATVADEHGYLRSYL